MSARDDEGLTLIELVVAAAIGVLVLVTLGSFFISSVSAQLTVTSTADAASKAQLLARQLDGDLRSASAVQVTNGAGGSQLLVARTSRGSGAGYVCDAWLFDATAGTLAHREFADRAAAPWGANPIAYLNGGSRSGWTLLADRVKAKSGTVVFAASGDRAAVVTFEIPAGAGRPPVLIATTATGRQAFANTGPSCF